MTVLERFLKYISIDTTSLSDSDKFPSADNQFYLLEQLKEELENLGITDINYDTDNCYLYACLKGDSQLPKVGFIAHLDTAENVPGKNIKPKIIKDYNGQDVQLNECSILSTEKFPDLKEHKGKTLITTDGTTLLGADDKAGIAEIMTALEHFSKTKERHGDIYVCFTPDEEIGKSLDRFKPELFPVTYAYTVDGSELGELSYENFNAATATINIKGCATHTGYAKGLMVNSLLIANAIISSLPEKEIPSETENYEGFFHLNELEGEPSFTKITYLIRDFDKQKFNRRKQFLQEVINKLNEQYGNRISLEIKDTYQNMRNIIEQDMTVVDIANTAMESILIKPIITPIRGGSDGADLSSLGIPCPNLGTGGHNFHSINEYITLEDMEKSTEVLIAIVKESSSRKVLKK